MLLEEKTRTGSRAIRIWSAGCSTGEEPYTLSMLLLEKIRNHALWDIQIVATDISRKSLEACRTAVYPPRSLKDVPNQYKEKYFTQVGNAYKVNDAVREQVQFSQLNLCSKGFMHNLTNLDCIFCRNVLIYFDDESANRVVNYFCNSLHPGGLLFLGHAEAMHRYTAAFETVKVNRCFVYKKEQNPGKTGSY